VADLGITLDLLYSAQNLCLIYIFLSLKITAVYSPFKLRSMLVTNEKNTSDKTCPICATWIEHWENSTGNIRARLCKVVRCGKAAEVGAHVKMARNFDNMSYIVPLCKEHNAAEGRLDILEDSDMAPAIKLPTCK
jgi:hypothetical protein